MNLRGKFTFAVLLFAFSTSANAQEKIKIALLAGFSGVSSISSFHLLNTAKMEVEKINSEGGFEGKMIELVILDDESNPIKTTEMANSAKLDDVAGVIGFQWSKFLLIAGEHLQRRKIPTISTLATHNTATHVGDYIFRVCFTNSYQGELLSRYAFKELGIKKALLFRNLENSYSNDLASSIRSHFEKLGGKIVKEIKYIPKHNKDYFVKEITDTPKSGFDAVFVPDAQVYSMPIMEVFRDLNMNDKIYIGGDSLIPVTQVKDDRLNSFKTYAAAHWDINNQSIENKNFIKRFVEKTNAEPQDTSALAHDALYVLLDAIKRAGSLDHKKIKDALYKTDYKGLTGRIRFDKNGDVLYKPMVIHVVNDGIRKSFVYQ